VRLVQQAQNSKAPGQRLADRAAFWLVLVALVAGGATFAGWLVAGRSVTEALLFAITVVVITCPDALGLATPTAVMVGTGMAARRGILFKTASALETSARIDTVVMDKTGTLTRGEPRVTTVITAEGSSEGQVLSWAAAVERESEHPLAKAIVAHTDASHPSGWRATGFRSVPGRGAHGDVGGILVAVGSPALLGELGMNVPDTLSDERGRLAASGQTAVLVGAGDAAVGVIALADAARDTAASAVAALHALGIEVLMLTGDNEATGQRIAAQLGIDQVIAGVLPDGKAGHIRSLQSAGRRVAMVGDGVNDAPALAAADAGIAIGAGTDVAIETADIVLMRSDPMDVAVALQIGRGTLRKMRQNLGWAIGYNALALPLAAGLLTPLGLMLRPEVAALAMSGSSAIVALNAVLLRRLRLPTKSARSDAA
jgi:Cu2+-exporting ATPase